LNLLGVSLRLAGEEFLALPGGIAAYRDRHATGLPLLAPWANRLAGTTYRVGRVRVDLEGLDLTTDGNGLPIHGTTWREAWGITGVTTGARIARMRALLLYDRPDQLAAFPFPHAIEVTASVDGTALAIETRVRPTADRAVPVSFGYHPYLRLPAGARANWRLALPARAHLELDAAGIPTGQRATESAEADPIGARTFDDGYAVSTPCRTEIREARHGLRVDFDEGYPYLQVYAPPRSRFVCLEPMTAPTNALGTGSYATVAPGDVYTARFSLRPTATP
jgi:galactose mutarotase-like enzyme